MEKKLEHLTVFAASLFNIVCVLVEESCDPDLIDQMNELEKYFDDYLKEGLE